MGMKLEEAKAKLQTEVTALIQETARVHRLNAGAHLAEADEKVFVPLFNAKTQYQARKAAEFARGFLEGLRSPAQVVANWGECLDVLSARPDLPEHEADIDDATPPKKAALKKKAPKKAKK